MGEFPLALCPSGGNSALVPAAHGFTTSCESEAAAIGLGPPKESRDRRLELLRVGRQLPSGPAGPRGSAARTSTGWPGACSDLTDWLAEARPRRRFDMFGTVMRR